MRLRGRGPVLHLVGCWKRQRNVLIEVVMGDFAALLIVSRRAAEVTAEVGMARGLVALLREFA